MTGEGDLPYLLAMIKAILSIISTAFKWLFFRKTREDLKKNMEAERDHKSRNEHEDIVEDASKTDDLDDIRRRASE